MKTCIVNKQTATLKDLVETGRYMLEEIDIKMEEPGLGWVGGGLWLNDA